MNFRFNACAMLCALLCFVSVALGGKWDKQHDPDKPKDSSESHSKDSHDEERLTSLRDYMGVSDAEWSALLPHVMKVQNLTLQLRALQEGSKSFDLSKPFKLPKELRPDGKPDAAQQLPAGSSGALIQLSETARQLRTVSQDKAASIDLMRSKLTAYRAARAQAQKQLASELAEARAQLTDLLTVRQELACVLSGLLE
jgi:hypothetical protein